jgi:hypothetical protein
MRHLHSPLEPMQSTLGIGLLLVDLAFGENVDMAALLKALDCGVDCRLVDSAAADSLNDLAPAKELGHDGVGEHDVRGYSESVRAVRHVWSLEGSTHLLVSSAGCGTCVMDARKA